MKKYQEKSLNDSYGLFFQRFLEKLQTLIEIKDPKKGTDVSDMAEKKLEAEKVFFPQIIALLEKFKEEFTKGYLVQMPEIIKNSFQ